MIYTCTFMPSLDYTVYLPDFQPAKLNRTDEVYYYPGGKGINVSRVLRRLGADTVATGFLGGFTGAYIEQFLHAEDIQTNFIHTDETTRINVKIKSAQETELNGPGAEIGETGQRQLLSQIQQLHQGDWLVIAGRIPPSLSNEYLGEIAEICEQKQVKLAVDTSGPALREILKRTKPFFIKPNQQELGELVGAAIRTKEEALVHARQLAASGVEHIVVSLGKEGALYVSNELELTAAAPKGQLVNSVGAGDSLVSGFIASYSADGDAEKAFRYGVASGSATAFQSDLCKREDVESLLSQVTITRR